MDKLLTLELTKVLIVLGIGAIAFSVIMAKMLAKLKNKINYTRKTTLIYLIIGIVLISSAAFLQYLLPSTEIFKSYLIYQLYFLTLGCVHIYLMRTKLAWGDEKDVFVPELLFTLLMMFISAFVMLLLSDRLLDKNYIPLMTPALIWIFVPFIFYYTYKKAIAIPPRVVRQWFYPIDQEIEEPLDSQLKDLLVISFEFQKKPGDSTITSFRAKAPADMQFGELFYYFLNDYNERNSNSKVQLVNGNGRPHGWIFYKKPKWHTFLTKYIDPGKTIFRNRIKENEVIICNRADASRVGGNKAEVDRADAKRGESYRAESNRSQS